MPRGRTVAAGGRRLVLLSGEAGIGKTHLVAGLADRVDGRGPPGPRRSVRRRGRPPYEPMAAALRTSQDVQRGARGRARRGAGRRDRSRCWTRSGGTAARHADRPVRRRGVSPLYSAVSFMLRRLAGGRGRCSWCVENAERIDRASAAAARPPGGAAARRRARRRQLPRPTGRPAPAAARTCSGDVAVARPDRADRPRARSASRTSPTSSEDVLPRGRRPPRPPPVGAHRRQPVLRRGSWRTVLADQARAGAGVLAGAGRRARRAAPPAADRCPSRHARSCPWPRCWAPRSTSSCSPRSLALPEDEVAQALDEGVAAGLLVESGSSLGGRYAFPHDADARRAPVGSSAVCAAEPAPQRGRGADGATAARPRGQRGHRDAPARRRPRRPTRRRRPGGACGRRGRRRSLYAWDEAIEHAEAAVALLDGRRPAAAPRRGGGHRRDAAAASRAGTTAEAVGAARDRAAPSTSRPATTARPARCTAGSAARCACTTRSWTSLAPWSTSTRRSGSSPPRRPCYHLHRGRAQAAMFGLRTALLDEAATRAEAIADRPRTGAT